MPSIAFISGRLAIMSAMRFRNAALPNIIITGTGPFALAGVTSVIWISTSIDGHDELSTCPTSCFSIDGEDACLRIRRAGYRPAHFGHVRRDAAEHFALEVFHDLRPPLIPPLLRRCTFCPLLR